MTQHITYNGKFLLDGNEIVNPEVLPASFQNLVKNEGKPYHMPLPATLRAEVEYYRIGFDDTEHIIRIVRLVEVESKPTGILAVGLPDYEPAFPEPEKQAIDETYGFGLPMERHIDTIRDLPTVEAIEYLDKLLSKAFVAGRSKQSWESFQNEIGKSSQPPPQAESQWISVKDRLPEKNGLYIIHKTADPNRSIEWLIDVVFYCKEAPFNRFVTHWMPLPTPPINPKH